MKLKILRHHLLLYAGIQIITLSAFSADKKSSSSSSSSSKMTSSRPLPSTSSSSSKDSGSTSSSGWFAFKASPQFELILGGFYSPYDYTQKIGILNPAQTFSYKRYGGDFSAYYRIFGLSAEYTDMADEKLVDQTALFNFRLYGRSQQGTQFTLHYGYRMRSNKTQLLNYQINNSFPAATLQFSFNKNFGIYGHYRKYLLTTEPVNGDTDGDELRYGLFFDLGKFRIQGSMFDEKQNSVLNAYPSTYNRKGYILGVQIYF